MKDNKYEITISFLGRNFPLLVTEEEEIRVKKAAKLIEEKLQELRQNYNITDEVSLAMMCSLEIAMAHILAIEDMEKYEKEMKDVLNALKDTSDIEEIEPFNDNNNLIIPE